MAVSIFPPASTGGGGGSNLPEGAVAQLIQGKLTTAGYGYPEILPAGTYRVNCNGNSVIATFGDNARTETISSTKDITIAGSETNLDFALAQNFGGTTSTITPVLPIPTLADLGFSWPKSVDFKVCPVSGNMLLLRGPEGTGNGSVALIMRQPDGQLRRRTSWSVGDARFCAGAIDQTNRAYLAHGTGTDVRLLRLDGTTGVGTNLYASSAWFTSFSGVGGVAVTPNGQSILLVGLNQNRAVFSSDSGNTWTNVTLPAQAYTSNTWEGAKVKYQGGHWFIPTTTAGQFMISTNGTTWTTYSIPGASSYVTGFATDGTVFVFACNNTNIIYRSTSLGTFTQITLTTLGTNTQVGLVEYGAGKWMATSGNSGGGNGLWWVSTNSGTTWTLIENSSTPPLTYGNSVGYWNSSETNNGTSVAGISQGAPTMNLYFDPRFNVFSATQFYYTTSSASLVEPLNVDATNYYRWAYSHHMYPSPSGWNQTTPLMYAVYSQNTDRWYYGIGQDDSWGMKRTFSYNPATGNIRTEPWAQPGFGGATVLSSTYNTSHYSDLPVGNVIWMSSRGGTNQILNYRTVSNPNQFWKSITAYTTASSPDISNSNRPVVFPDGSAAFLVLGTNASTMNNLTVDATGTATNLFNWQDGFAAQLATALLGGGFVSYNTVAKTINAQFSTSRWTGIPYPMINLGGSVESQYRTTLPTGTAYQYVQGNYVVTFNTTAQTVSVSTNGGISAQTYPGLGSVVSVFERNGTFYILSYFGTTTRILKIQDWSSGNYEILGDTGITVARELWEHNVESDYGLVSNPVVMGTRGEILQLFSIPNAQPPANLFMYDMNLEVL